MSKKGRPPKAERTLKEQIESCHRAGIPSKARRNLRETESIIDLDTRITQILGIIQKHPIKATDMFYLVMYDIEDHKVRTTIAKYLMAKGCIRIQKSVYLARSENKTFETICRDLKEVQEAYENEDSIILAPVNTQTVSSMKVYGKNLQIDILVDKPNTLFF